MRIPRDTLDDLNEAAQEWAHGMGRSVVHVVDAWCIDAQNASCGLNGCEAGHHFNLTFAIGISPATGEPFVDAIMEVDDETMSMAVSKPHIAELVHDLGQVLNALP